MIRRPARVDEHGALAAHRLGDQRLLAGGVRAGPQHGRVELHDLDVGDLGPGPQRQRQPVAGGAGRVGRRGEDLAVAAGGEHGGPGAQVAGIDQRPVGAQIRATRRPTTRPSAARSASSATVCSSTSTPRARRAPASVRVTSAPLASPPACTIRLRLCPPSRVSAGCPRPSRSRRAPSVRSSAIASGASSTSVRTASSSHSPAPAASVSCTCSSASSSGPSTAARPPCAQRGAAAAERVLGDDDDRRARRRRARPRSSARRRRCRRRRRRCVGSSPLPGGAVRRRLIRPPARGCRSRPSPRRPRGRGRRSRGRR